MLKKYGLFASVMLTISLVAVLTFYNVLTPEKKLPIYQPNMVKFQLVDSTIQHIKRFHKIDDFKLINQNNEVITNETYDGKIYIAGITARPDLLENMISALKNIKGVVEIVNYVIIKEQD